MNQYTIRAIVRSKKNSRRLFSNNGHMVSLVSKAYAEFRDEALIELMTQRPKDLKPPYVIYYTFFSKGRRFLDLDNAVTSINDILQDAHIIGDDMDIVELHARKNVGCKQDCTIIKILQP
jgi:Holliday junction resolvase RusA-like endonuclease